MAENTAAKSARGRPFLHGFDPRRGRGLKGRSGRRPDEYLAWLRALLDDPTVRQRLEAVLLADPDPDHFLKALRLVEERVFGKPTHPTEPVGKLEIVVRDE